MINPEIRCFASGTCERHQTTYIRPNAPRLLFLVFFAVLMAGGLGSAAAGPSPLQAEFAKAVGRGDHDKVRALLARDVDVNGEIGGFVPIMLAKDAEMVSLLVSAGADVNATASLLPGQTPLMFAAINKNAAVARSLVDAGAAIDRINEQSGATALLTAIGNGGEKIVEMLVGAGADVNAGRYLGMPPLHLAVTKGNERIVRILLEAGADTEVKDDSGATAIMLATRMRRKKVLNLLVDAGADVNAKGGTAHAKSAKREKKKKGTLMDLALATGDPDIIETLSKAGAKKSKRPPRPDEHAVNPPGRYTLECSVSDPPPTSAKDVSCSSEGEVVDSGVETSVVSSAFYEGGRPVPKKDGCEVELGIPGTYTIRQWRTRMKWQQICRYRLRGVETESWLVGVKKGNPEIKQTEYKITVGGEARKSREKDEKKPPSIKIIKPVKDEQFVFDASVPGVLEIDAEAVVEGDCDSAATWKVEDVAGSEKRLTPEGSSNAVRIRYEGLPSGNDAFGRKRITATACGKSASVTVEVFFPPKAINHPGKGSGETPNWFYYWGQTKAGDGFSPEYMEKHPCGTHAVGTYWFDRDKIALYPATFTGVCFKRTDGSQAKGIDCYAETLIHESIHQQELKYWWNNIPTGMGDLRGMASKDSGILAYIFPAPVSCDTSLALTLNRRVRNWVMSIDSDGDLVPDYIENSLDGCDAHNAFSCPGVPPHVMRKAKAINHKIDVDMNTYRISWKKWKIGSANKEDWAQCGKQWKDSSVCPP